MEKRKSAGFVVDDALWRRFKSRAADEGLPIGEILVKLVKAYLDGKDASFAARRRDVGKGGRKTLNVGKSETGGKKGADDGAKQAPLRRKREHAQDDEGAGSPERTPFDPTLLRYAERLSVPVGDDEEELLAEVLAAIEREYRGHEGDTDWIDANLVMLRWYNDNG